MMKFKTKLTFNHQLIDLTPLVDVIFLLLIFFLITSDVLPLKSLNIDSPSLNKNTKPLTSQVLVVMDAQYVIYVGSKKEIVALSALKEHVQKEIDKLKKLNGNSSVPSIVLSIDKKIDYETFLQIFSIIQEFNTKIRLVYKPDMESESYE